MQTMPQPTADDAVELASRFLARREHSARELQAKLVARGVEPDVARAALASLRTSGYQSDARFAEERTRDLLSRGYGSQYVFRDLCDRGIDEDTARGCARTAASTDAERAQQLMERRDPEARERNRRYLINRGYPGAVVTRALRRAS